MAQHRRKLWLVLLTTLACLGVVSVVLTLLVLEPMPPTLGPRSTLQRDLPQIMGDGVLRVALCPDEVSFFLEGGRPLGLAYELAHRTARRLGVRLELAPASNPAAGLRDVLRGRADVLAATDSGPRTDVDEVAWTSPFGHRAPVVLGRGADAVRRLEDLRGETLTVIRNTALDELASDWQKQLGGQLDIQRAPAVMTARELAAGVARGAWRLALLDQDRARLEASLHRHLRVSPPLDDSLPVRWAVRPDSPDLARAISILLNEMRIVGLVAELERRYVESPDRLHGPWLGWGSSHPRGASPWDGVFQEAGARHGFDWRLLAALSWAESRHDPTGIGPGGSIGLMQLMPGTAREFGAEDPFDPVQNVAAGASHLRWLFDILSDVPEEDRLAFALAAYNMGLGHLSDARGLAAAQGLDADRWTDHVEVVLPLMEDPLVASNLDHGFARGALTRRYVDRVLALYRSYGGPESPIKRAAAIPVRTAY